MPATSRDATYSAIAYQGGPPAMYEDGVSTPGTIGLGIGAGARISADGTPSRVAGLLLLAATALVGLKLSGIRFNVGVTS